jgi:hypothetical protein
MGSLKKRPRGFIADYNDLVRRLWSGIIRHDDHLPLMGEATNGIAASGGS